MISLPRKFNYTGTLARAMALAIIASPLVACGNSNLSSSATPNADESVAVASSAAASSSSSAPVVAQQTSYADVISRVSPAVVTVNSTGRKQTGRNPMLDDPMLREFFGGRIPQMPQRPSRGLGSGIIVTPDGYILTNNHVVDDAEKVTITLTNNQTYDAKVVGTDPASDLAVLKINANNLPVLPLGNSDNVRVGDIALAIGNPLGVGQTVTSGIISAKSRETRAGSGESFEDFIQTDAPINQGNSGGALINANGELIGINSQILSPSGGSIGIGFAIPSNMAKNVMDQLVKNGKVRRGYLGIGLQPVTSDIAASLNLSEVRGAIATQVEPGSPAERAGFRRGDVITAINGTPVTDSNALRNRVAATQPGEVVTFTVRRGTGEQQLRATLGERPSETARNDNAAPNSESNNATPETGKLGLSLEPVTPEIARQLDLRAGAQGLVIRNVDPDGPAADAGLQRGDVVEEVNGQQVRVTEDLRAALNRSQNRPILLLVNRGGNSRFFTVRPQQS